MPTIQRLLRLLTLLVLPAYAAAMPVSPAPLFTLTVLPTDFAGVKINAAGQVVGTFNDTAAIWTRAGVTTFDGMPAGSLGSAINDRGDIAGSWNENVFVYSNGTFANLGKPLDSVGPISALGINNAGQVAGNYIGEGYTRGFLYTDGQFETIGTYSGIGNSSVRGLNNGGSVVGWSTTGAADTPMHALLYANRTLEDIGTFPGAMSSSAQDINDAGQIVGMSGSRPFVYKDGTMRDIGAARDLFAEGLAINDAGTVVGVGDYLADGAFEPYAFIYTNGRNFDLNTRIADIGDWALDFAVDVNEAGQILAWGCAFHGPCGSLLLDPVTAVPEPAHGMLLAAGLVLLAGAKKHYGRERRAYCCQGKGAL